MQATHLCVGKLALREGMGEISDKFRADKSRD